MSDVFSLWYTPPEPLRTRLQAEIDALARQHDGPRFPPHVTLLGPVEGLTRSQALEKTRCLAASLQPLPIDFERVATGGAFFQCVFLLARPSPQLLDAAARARAVFGGDPAQPYMPHLSLLYSNLSQHDRHAVAEEAQAELFGAGEGALPSKGFTASSVSLWLTPPGDDTLSNWQLVEEVPFGA